MFKFVVTDGRPWYKQVVSGAFKGVALAVLLLLLYAEPKFFIVFGFVAFISLLAGLYCWAAND